jgi:uncharacterized protein
MPKPEQPMVDMMLARIVTYEHGEQQSIFLRERGGKRGFPILIGTNEAHEIHRVVTRIEPHRPLTHKLLHDTMAALGARLVRVEITALKQATFFARLVVEPAGADAPIHVDARPSDAIALAVRAGCPIHVAAEVVAQAAGESVTPDDEGDEPPKKGKKKA